MNSTNERVERRKHKRFQVDNGALILLGWYYEKVGRIIDISEGGVAFRYMPHGEEQNGSDLAIVLPETNFYLDEVPTTTISDFELADKTPTTSITARRRGVQFMNPTHHQKSQIEFFINNYATSETEPSELTPYSISDEPAKARNGLPS
ncbi:MAG: PilZ domain-containing protein [Deltaproteobacteria bacterium]|nr:PilZ domain-containing protein [Deltaproteobacteria bacterium]